MPTYTLSAAAAAEVLMIRSSSRLCLIVSSLVFAFWASSDSNAQDWTRFHGPNGSGYIADGKIPDSWTADDEAWAAELPGGGISSPVAWGDKVFLLAADPKTAVRHVLAYQLSSGKQLWDKTFDSVPHHLHKRNRFAASTPCCDEKFVYVAWSEPQHTTVSCLTHEGELVWQRDLGRWQSQHGFATSPMLYEDFVIVFDSQQARQLKPGETAGESKMVALNRQTGQMVWETPLETTNVCYGTPCVYQPAGGAAQLVDANTGNGLFGLDPKTGKMLWNLKVFRSRCCSSPVVAGDLVLGSAGSGGGGNHLVAVRPGEEPTEAYRVERGAPYVPTSVVVGDMAFLCGDNGVATCIDVKSGEPHWTRRIGGTISSSPIVVGDKLLTIDMDGKATVLRAGKKFEKLGTADLHGNVQATPAYTQGYLLLRSENRLTAIGPKRL
ncbi:PQQ-binding-like beta-propeller repeat protein [Rosistilla oblonga]|uniref:outer membrane protein assembly factor BamB family protein n=1 Tax=Rosistilla oblonga TaxID=2527990 RepID=UPI00119D9A18|nr:PQQ-binding-like beta-propeller repeat protein [Rosistilla oblonga]